MSIIIDHILVKICQYLNNDTGSISKLFRLNKAINAILNTHRQIIFKNILNFCGFYPQSDHYMPIIYYLHKLETESNENIISALNVHKSALSYPNYINFDFNRQDKHQNTYIMHVCTYIGKFNEECPWKMEEIDYEKFSIYDFHLYFNNLFEKKKLDLFIKNDNGDDVLAILLKNQHLKYFDRLKEDYRNEFIALILDIIYHYFSNDTRKLKLLHFVKTINDLYQHLFMSLPDQLIDFIGNDNLFINSLYKNIDINSTDEDGYTALAHMMCLSGDLWEERICQILDIMEPDLKNDKHALSEALKYSDEMYDGLIPRLLGLPI